MNLQQNVDLQNYNTLRLSALAQYFVEATDESDARDAVLWAEQRNLPVTVLGEGSNVVCRPYIPGLVLLLRTTGVQLITDDGRHIRLRVAAGENWNALVHWSAKQGFHGLENLVAIPGSVGAAPVQNIGAYGVEVAQFIGGIRALDTGTAQIVHLSPEDCAFGYRDSLFKRKDGKHLLIMSVDFVLDRQAKPIADYPSLNAALAGDPATPQRVLDCVKHIRQQRLPDPTQAPNVGSFFKNPTVSWHQGEVMSMRWPDMPQYPAAEGSVKLSAAWLVEQAGWRGRSEAGVGMSDQHALILVNHAARTAQPVLSVADSIVESVDQAFGVRLQMEPVVLGVDSTVAA